MSRRIRVHYKKRYVYAFVSDHKYEAVRKLRWQYIDGYAIHYYKKGDRITHISMHRFVMGCKHGDGIELDHRDRNKLNNTDENIRKCTHTQNVRNATTRKDNTSGYRGVSWESSSNKWVANIQYDKKQYKIGRYATKEEAAIAYDKWATKHHGEFAVTNSPKRSKL